MEIRSDYDQSADFGSYETYAFMERPEKEGEGYQNLFSKHMIDSITIEMEKRGYKQSSSPDLLVTFNAVLEDKVEVTTTTAPMINPVAGGYYGFGGYYGYRRGYYSTWSGYDYATETHVSNYTDGTFNIDLIDAKRQQLVWEAVGVGHITEKDKANLEIRITMGVPKFFATYPFTAGDPNLVTAD